MPSGAAMIVPNSTIVTPSRGGRSLGAASAGRLPRLAWRLGEQLLRVLAGLRVPAGRLARRLAELRDRAELAHRPVARMLEGDDLVVSLEVRVQQAVLRGLHRLRGDLPVRLEELHPLVEAAILHPLQHQVAERAARLRRQSRRGVDEARIGVDLGEADRADVGVEVVLEEIRQLDPAPVAGDHGVVLQRRHRLELRVGVALEAARVTPGELRAHEAEEVRAGTCPAAGSSPRAVRARRAPARGGRRGCR